MPPLEGEVPNEREAEGFVRKLSKKTPQSARSGCQLPFQGSQGGFAARVARLATPTSLILLTMRSYIFNSCKSPIRPRCVRTNRDERELTNHHVSARIKLRRMYTTTHGTTSRRLYLELKTVCKSVLEPPFQAQISGTLSPYTKDCFNTC